MMMMLMMLAWLMKTMTVVAPLYRYFSCLPDSNQQAGVTEDDDADAGVADDVNGGGGGIKIKLTGKC